LSYQPSQQPTEQPSQLPSEQPSEELFETGQSNKKSIHERLVLLGRNKVFEKESSPTRKPVYPCPESVGCGLRALSASRTTQK